VKLITLDRITNIVGLSDAQKYQMAKGFKF